MNKIVLSAVAALTIGALSASAGGVKLYSDTDGQVFTSAGEGRTEIKDSGTSVSAKASKLKFSGKHYLGFTYKNKEELSAADGGLKAERKTGNFEMRRNYLQVKAYLLEDPKSYLRVTLDASYTESKANDDGKNPSNYAQVYVKYAYLYLNDILPFTGVELGMVHRPWADYEQGQGWKMRSISKVFSEGTAHLLNSSDLGFNFRTKTDYFTSELGIFNGEGYHGSNGDETKIGTGVSAEWRLTGAMLGNGTKKRKVTKDTYADASFFGQYNADNSKNEVKNDAGGEEAYDYTILGVHAVYNMPNFLIAAQYVSSDNDGSEIGAGTSKYNGTGYSINATARFGDKKEYSVIARYDDWEAENEALDEKYQTNTAIYGVAWRQNKNVKWLLSGESYRADDHKSYKGKATQDWDAAMVTAEIKW
ncbi:MAG: hypothetical protein JJW00_03425 [Sulfurimonas sp.]|nr:hypothetical protein [Sulfurimonas sp.]